MKKKTIIGVVTLLIILIPPIFNIGLVNGILPNYLISRNKNSINDNLILSTTSLELISDNLDDDSEPAIAIDSNDIIHLVWYAYDYSRGKRDIIYANSSDNFFNKQRISELSTNDDDPVITVDSLDRVHIAWEGSNQIYYTNSSNFTSYIIVSKQSSVETPQIFCDSTNIVHLVWAGFQAGNWDVFYANSSDNFSNNEPVSKTTYNDEVPDIYVINGIVHIVWSKFIDYDDYRIAYSNSTDFFATEKTISQGDYASYHPKIAVDNSGNVHIVWHGERSTEIDLEIIYQLIFLSLFLDYYNDVPFVPRRYNYIYYPFLFPFTYDYYYDYDIFYANSINNFQSYRDISRSVTDESYNPDIIIDSNNIIHIIWWGYTDTSYSYSFDSHLFYTNSSENFGNFKTYSRDGYNQYPRIANDSGNGIHCVFVSYYNSYDIYYLNTTDFQTMRISEESIWDLMQLIFAIPKMPDLSLLSYIVLGILGGFNLIAIIIFAKKKSGEPIQEPKHPPSKPDESKKEEFKRKTIGKKLTIKKKDKKVTVKLP
ncbi:MAG: hypothetical protein ACFFCM_01025 [Promethearchaeota archaeon]